MLLINRRIIVVRLYFLSSKVDIESVIAGHFAPDTKSKAVQFYVDKKQSWVEFRAGHSGDAGFLASLFSRTEENVNDSDKETEGSSESLSRKAEALEMRIANSLGDEHSSPAVQVIIADYCKLEAERENDTEDDQLVTKEICGAVLVTIDWNPYQSMRYLRVEEIAIDESKIALKGLLVRRLFLSLSAIALKASCGGLLVAKSAKAILDSNIEMIEEKDNR